MKPYIIFKWDRYYPCGGWNDYEARFETLEQAEEWHEQHPLEWEQTRQVVVDGEVVQRWYGEGW